MKNYFIKSKKIICNNSYSIAISPDGNKIITGNGNNSTSIWDSNNSKHLYSLNNDLNEY